MDEYLDDIGTFEASYASVPELVFTVEEDNGVVGICYGMPDRTDSAGAVVLQGIAVSASVAGHGIRFRFARGVGVSGDGGGLHDGERGVGGGVRGALL